MEYEFLIGHRVKINYFDITANKNRENIGYIHNIITDDIGEKMIISQDGKDMWFFYSDYTVKNLHIEILDNEIKKYIKFTRFEIMEI